ncbi:MAG TPA: hypothetical protein VN633_20500 [Bryobacteraceae bacterium]|nr:hypothetical protein [Bryobacteraceae bacterium]
MLAFVPAMDMTENNSSEISVPSFLSKYRGFAGLPPLVGLHSMEEAMTKGLTVQESVDRLKRIRWALKRLHGILIARLAAVPIYELKMAFSLHAYYCAEHVAGIAERVREMRQPPYGLTESPSAEIDIFFDEIEAAPDTSSLILGIYEEALPALVRSLRRLTKETNRLFDHPGYRLCRWILLEMEEVRDYGEKAVASLVRPEDRTAFAGWIELLRRISCSAGDLDGTAEPLKEPFERMFSAVPREYDGTPKRDERFKDPYNMGVNAEALLFDPDVDPLPKSIMLFFKRMREIDVPEVISSIIAEQPGRSWDYYLDMTRQLWDEARHAMMGEVGFASLGIDWSQVPVNLTWSLELNTKLTPRDRHAVLYTIEQGLMPKKNGKEYEWQVALRTSNRLTSLIQDYDWADEVLHARIGRRWLVPEFASQAEAQACGDKAWSQATANWAAWRDEGLTEHRNWWPEIYRAACRHWGMEPDAELLKYQTTYEDTRADLKHSPG